MYETFRNNNKHGLRESRLFDRPWKRRGKERWQEKGVISISESWFISIFALPPFDRLPDIRTPPPPPPFKASALEIRGSFLSLGKPLNRPYLTPRLGIYASGNIASLKSRIINRGKKKKEKEKEKRRGETRKLESFLSNEIIQSRSPIRSAKIQDWKTWIEPSASWKKETGRKEGKKFLSFPGSRDNLNQRVSRVKAKLPYIGRFDIDPNRGKIMEKPSFAFYRIARRIWNFNRASPPEKSPLDRVVDASRRKWRDVVFHCAFSTLFSLWNNTFWGRSRERGRVFSNFITPRRSRRFRDRSPENRMRSRVNRGIMYTSSRFTEAGFTERENRRSSRNA